MRKRPILKMLRLIWVAGGLCFTLWLVLSYQAQGVSPQVLNSDEAVEINETSTVLQFIPRARQHGLAFLFLPGALVDPHAYAPMGRSVAEHGFEFIIVKPAFRMALSASQEASVYRQIHEIIQRAPQIQRWVLGGHSRGGAIAARFAAQYPSEISGLVLMGTSHPKEAEGDLSALPLKVVKIAATNDGLASEAEVEADRRYLPPDAQLVWIEGGNHAQFGWYGPQLGDGAATISREQQQQIIVEALVEFFSQLVR